MCQCGNGAESRREFQQAAEAQNRELEGIRSETEAEIEAEEVKQLREVPEQ